MKYLLLLLLAVYVLWRWRAGQAARVDAGHPQDSVPAAAVAMVACAQCGLHVPISYAVCVGSRYFCSAAHRESDGA